jgi:hypothetical protein
MVIALGLLPIVTEPVTIPPAPPPPPPAEPPPPPAITTYSADIGPLVTVKVPEDVKTWIVLSP